jgi:hypothetical protein
MSQGILKTLGRFDDKEAAMRAYDEAAIELSPSDQLNFDDIAELHETAVASSALQKRSSQFRGVCWNNKLRKWRASVQSKGAFKHLGIFGDEEAATRAYDKGAIEWGLLTKLNFDDYDPPETASASASHAAQQRSSRFRGVSWHKGNRKWIARLRVQGVPKYLGTFDDEEAAARACDKGAIECGLLDQLNFDDYELRKTASASPASPQEISQFQRVSWHKTSRNEDPEWQCKVY